MPAWRQKLCGLFKDQMNVLCMPSWGVQINTTREGHGPNILYQQKMFLIIKQEYNQNTCSHKQIPFTSSTHNFQLRKQIQCTHCSSERRSRAVHSWVVEVGMVRLDRWWRGRPDATHVKCWKYWGILQKVEVEHITCCQVVTVRPLQPLVTSLFHS